VREGEGRVGRPVFMRDASFFLSLIHHRSLTLLLSLVTLKLDGLQDNELNVSLEDRLELLSLLFHFSEIEAIDESLDEMIRLVWICHKEMEEIDILGDNPQEVRSEIK
jgi:hypothetical protein